MFYKSNTDIIPQSLRDQAKSARCGSELNRRNFLANGQFREIGRVFLHPQRNFVIRSSHRMLRSSPRSERGSLRSSSKIRICTQ